MNRRVICSLIICAAVANTAFGITIQPNEADSSDTFGYQFLPAMNLSGGGFGTMLAVGATTTGHDTQAVIAFDLAAVGLTGAQVQSASLNLFAIDTALTGFGASPTPGAPITVDLAPLAASFDEATVAWATIPAAGAVETSQSIDGINQTFSFDVTDLVKQWLDGALTNNGVLLTANAPVGGSPSWVYAVFSSASGQVAPALVITPVPEPASALLALIAAPAIACAAVRRVRRQSRLK